MKFLLDKRFEINNKISGRWCCKNKGIVQKPSKYQPKTFEEYLERISPHTSKDCQNMHNKVAKYKELMVKILVDWHICY